MTRRIFLILAACAIAISAQAQQASITIALTPSMAQAIDLELSRSPITEAGADTMTRAQLRSAWAQREIKRILEPAEKQIAVERAATIETRLSKLTPTRCRAVAKELGVDESVCGG